MAGEEQQQKGVLLVDGIRITSVFDNWGVREEVQTAWGFAAIIEANGMAPILFDSGSEGLKLLKNMEILGFDPKQLSTVVLSHEHWDHVGGIEVLLKENPEMDVFIPATFSRGLKAILKRAARSVIEVKDARQILPGVLTTGVMGDSIPEQSLVLATNRGGVLITGCAHPGIVNILERTNSLVDHVFMALGGFHLRDATELDIQAILERFRDLGVQYAGPCHCSGDAAKQAFQNAYDARYLDIKAGTRLDLAGL